MDRDFFNSKIKKYREKRAGERARHGEKNAPEWRGVSVVQEVFGLCYFIVWGPKLMSRCKPAKMDTKKTRNMLNILRKLEQGVVPDKEPEGWTTGNKGFVTFIISVP